MQNINIVPTMSGVTTALVLFVLGCLLYPSAIRNRTQFYAGFVAVLLIVLLFSLDVMIRQPGFQVFCGAVTGLLQLFALLMFFLSAGGMSVGELAGDLKRAYEVVRRGEEEKTIIIPLSGQKPRAAGSDSPASATRADDEILPRDAAPPKPPETGGSIPLEPADSQAQEAD